MHRTKAKEATKKKAEEEEEEVARKKAEEEEIARRNAHKVEAAARMKAEEEARKARVNNTPRMEENNDLGSGEMNNENVTEDKLPHSPENKVAAASTKQMPKEAVAQKGLQSETAQAQKVSP